MTTIYTPTTNMPWMLYKIFQKVELHIVLLLQWVSDTWIRGTQNQRLKWTNPRGIHALKPQKKLYQGSTYTDTPSSARMRIKMPGTLDCVPIRTRHGRREVSTPENLRLARPGVGSVDPPSPTYSLTRHSMQSLPPTSLQHHRRESSTRV
jgi:hypothetical protein